MTYTGYFTARIRARTTGDTAPNRQDVYVRGLERLGVDVVYGRFMPKKKHRPLVLDPTERVIRSRGDVLAYIRDTEEKGSDVNLATRLLVDYFTASSSYDASLVVSNDSDLKMPVATLRNLGCPSAF